MESDTRSQILKFKNDNKLTNEIRLVEDYKRYYRYGAFASTVLGFTGTDNQGLAGVEAEYDNELTGTAGRLKRKMPWEPICRFSMNRKFRRKTATALS